MKKCIVNGKVILHDEIVEKNIFIENDKIVEINGESTNNDAYKAAELISNSSWKCNLLIERNGELLKYEIDKGESANV